MPSTSASRSTVTHKIVEEYGIERILEMPVGPPSNHGSSEERGEEERRTLNLIYDLHRICAQNKMYFDWKATKLKKNITYLEWAIEFVIALVPTILIVAQFISTRHEAVASPSSPLIDFILGQHDTHTAAVPLDFWLELSAKGFSFIALIMVAAKIIMEWGKKYEEYAAQYQRYNHAFLMVDKLVQETKRRNGFIENRHEWLWDGSQELAAMARSHDPDGSLANKKEKEQWNKFQDDVNKAYPPDYYIDP